MIIFKQIIINRYVIEIQIQIQQNGNIKIYSFLDSILILWFNYIELLLFAIRFK